MYSPGKRSRLCPFPIMGNGHGRVTEPMGDQFSGRNLGMIPYLMNGLGLGLGKILVKFVTPHAQVSLSVGELKVFFVSFLT